MNKSLLNFIIFCIVALFQDGAAQDVTSTTPTPVQTVFTLDMIGDQTSEWTSVIDESQCLYSTYITDFRHGWGCGGPESDLGLNITTIGYWTACRVDTCHLTFYHEVFQANSIQIKVMLEGDAEIRISAKSNPQDTENIHILTIISEDNMILNEEIYIDLSPFQRAKFLDFTIVSSTNKVGFALVDKIVVSRNEGGGDGNEGGGDSAVVSFPTASLIFFLVLAQFIKY